LKAAAGGVKDLTDILQWCYGVVLWGGDGGLTCCAASKERGGIEESKKVEIGQLGDKVEQMKNAGEFPVVAKKGVMGRVKDKVTGH
jgi:hypothetical protein